MDSNSPTEKTGDMIHISTPSNQANVRLRFLGLGIILTFLSIFANLISFTNNLVVARLGPESYGLYTSLLNIYILFSTLSSTVQTTINEQTARFRQDNQDSQRNIFFNQIITTTLYFTGIAFLLSLLALPFSKLLNLLAPRYLLIIAAFLPLEAWFAITQGFFQGLEKQTLASILFLFRAILRLVLTFILYSVFKNVQSALASIGLSTIALLIPSLFYVWRFTQRDKPYGYTLSSPKIILLKITSVIKPIILVTTILLQINTSSHIIIARARLLPDQAGQYSAATTIANLMLIFATISVVIIFPSLVKRQASGKNIYPLSITAAAILLLLGCFITILTKFYSLNVLSFLFGDKYFESAQYIWQLIPAITLQGITFIFAFTFIIQRKWKFVQSFAVLVVFEVAALILVYPTIQSFIIYITLFNLIMVITCLWHIYHKGGKK